MASPDHKALICFSSGFFWGIHANSLCTVNTLRPRQNGRHFADDIFRRIFLNENVCISLKISLKFVPKVRINNIPALVQIMAWRRPGDKPLSEPMMISLLTHIYVIRPQWVKDCCTITGPITLLPWSKSTNLERHGQNRPLSNHAKIQ